MPKLLTSRGDYGLLLMTYLARQPRREPQSLPEIAKALRLPQTFLEQIALDLRRAHLLAARRGKEGGYFLTRSPERISVIEVLETLEGPLQVVTCQGGKCSASSSCLTHGFWRVLQRYLHQTLRRITLTDLLTGSPHKLLPLAQGGRRLGRSRTG